MYVIVIVCVCLLSFAAFVAGSEIAFDYSPDLVESFEGLSSSLCPARFN